MRADCLKNSSRESNFACSQFDAGQFEAEQSLLHAEAYSLAQRPRIGGAASFALAQATPAETQVIDTNEVTLGKDQQGLPFDAKPAGSTNPVETKAMRASLETALDSFLTKDKEHARIRSEMDAFEKRAEKDHLKPEQVAETYSQISRLLTNETNTTLPLQRRVQLAQQVLRQAADPAIIDQGKHNTCIANSLEVRAYFRNPEKAVKVVADLSLKNTFRTLDGTEISLDVGSLTPDEEAKNIIPASGERSFASQLFVIAANNAYWLRTEDGANGGKVAKGSYRYSQGPNWRGFKINSEGKRELDFGERVIDMRTNPLTWVAERPALPVDGIEDIYAQMTGDTAGGFVISAKNKDFKMPNSVESPEQLKQRVIKLKEDGLMPAVLIVHTNNDIWMNDPGLWHSVNILDYVAEKDKLFMSDQYGKSSDRIMKPRDLFNAASGPSGWKEPVLPGRRLPR